MSLIWEILLSAGEGGAGRGVTAIIDRVRADPQRTVQAGAVQ